MSRMPPWPEPNPPCRQCLQIPIATFRPALEERFERRKEFSRPQLIFDNTYFEFNGLNPR
jgi:hypothetical protein